MKKESAAAYNGLLERTWRASGGDWDAFQDTFTETLSKEPKESIVEFWKLHRKRVSMLFCDAIYHGGYLMLGSVMGNDGFMEFADKIAVLPLAAVEKVVSDPDSMVDYPILEKLTEQTFESIFLDVYDEKMGADDGEFLLYEAPNARNVIRADWKAIGRIDLEKQLGLDRIRAKYEKSGGREGARHRRENIAEPGFVLFA